MKDRLTTTSLTALILCVSSGVLSLPLTLNQKLASEIYPSSNIQALGTSIFCDTCEWLVDKLQKMFESNVSEDLIAKAIIEFCELFKIEDKYICSTIVPEFKVRVQIVVVAPPPMKCFCNCNRILVNYNKNYINAF